MGKSVCFAGVSPRDDKQWLITTVLHSMSLFGVEPSQIIFGHCYSGPNHQSHQEARIFRAPAMLQGSRRANRSARTASRVQRRTCRDAGGKGRQGAPFFALTSNVVEVSRGHTRRCRLNAAIARTKLTAFLRCALNKRPIGKDQTPKKHSISGSCPKSNNLNYLLKVRVNRCALKPQDDFCSTRTTFGVLTSGKRSRFYLSNFYGCARGDYTVIIWRVIRRVPQWPVS